MNLSRISEITPQQLLSGTSALLGLILIAVQFWAFGSGDASGISTRSPAEVRSSREKVQVLAAARAAIASRGVADPAAIPRRSYVPQSVETAEAIEEIQPEFAAVAPGEQEPEAIAIVPVPPQLKGIVQVRDLRGNLRLRAIYPQGNVAAGALIDGYRVKAISADRVVLVRDGQETVQRVASGAFGTRVL